MAVEEVEYYSLHQGNGRSLGDREGKAKAKKKTKRQGSSSGFTSFVQGVTLGTVLLIPVGVWCWVRVDDLAPKTQADEITNKAKSARTKPAANPVSKRKPMRISTARSAAAPKATVVPLNRLAEAEPPPKLPLAPPSSPVAVPLVIRPAPELAEDIPQKPKKGVWRTLSTPFRGKGKAPPEPDGSEN